MTACGGEGSTPDPAESENAGAAPAGRAFAVRNTATSSRWILTDAPGSYPTKACFYEEPPTDLRLPGDVSDVTPRTCVDTTLVVPEGATSVTVDI